MMTVMMNMLSSLFMSLQSKITTQVDSILICNGALG